MKKLINLFFLLLALTTMSLISCSKNEIENDVFEFDIPDGNRELYDQITTELYDYLYSHEDATIEDIQDFLTKYPTQVTSEVHDDILYLKIDSVYDFICDPYGNTRPDEMENFKLDGYETSNILKEVESTLYPDGGYQETNTRSADYKSNVSTTRNNTRSLFGGKKYLRKRNILLWDPWNISQLDVNTIKNIFNDKLHIKPCIGLKAKLEMIKEFVNYDVVYMCCHGTPEGEICMPSSRQDWYNVYTGRGRDLDTGLKITKEQLENLFSGLDLSETVIWTSICYAGRDNSILKKIVFEDAKAAAFSGCDNKAKTNYTSFPFPNFLRCLYGRTTRTSVQDAAILSIPLKLYELINYKDIKHYTDDVLKPDRKPSRIQMEYSGHGVSGNYWFDWSKTPVYAEPIGEVSGPIYNKPVAALTLPYDQLQDLLNRIERQSTRSSSDDNIAVGFWFKNKNTGEISEMNISDSTVTAHKKYNYKDLCGRIELLGKTDNLAPGTYEYRTYFEIDGEKEYSDSIYEFTVMDIKHLSCPDYNHPHLIDLGLPSGTKWLCCNLGVDNLVNTGHYFAWGVTLPYDKNDYQLMHYPRFYYPYSECHGGSDLDLAYQWDGDIYTDIGNNISGTAYDAAYSKSNLIRMPTKEDFEELIESCAFLMGPVCISDGTSSNLIYSGSVAIGPNGNMIALPIANYWTGTLSKEEESGGALLAYPRVNGVSGSAYSFVGEDVNYTSVSLDESVKLLLHYIKDDEVDRNIYYFIGSKFYMPSIAPKKRFHPYYIRPVGR